MTEIKLIINITVKINKLIDISPGLIYKNQI